LTKSVVPPKFWGDLSEEYIIKVMQSQTHSRKNVLITVDIGVSTGWFP
jgi:hypothetical protein